MSKLPKRISKQPTLFSAQDVDFLLVTGICEFSRFDLSNNGCVRDRAKESGGS